MNWAIATSRDPLVELRELGQRSINVERCELCSATLGPEHDHLFELDPRRLVCACPPCALLFSSRDAPKYRRIPRSMQLLADIRVSDEQWEGLHLPINLAFFYFDGREQNEVAVYPSPAGPIESLLSLDAWQELVAANPVLGEMEADVEALLVNRLAQGREHYRVGIDQCYRLVGLMRREWRGLSGGAAVWEQIRNFFADLRERSSVVASDARA
jgi:hypothetical protein